jgi:hypothetical protein
MAKSIWPKGTKVKQKMTTPNNPIEIFKAGTHTAMSGQTVTFSESDIEAVASAYDPAKHEAPIVIGHPATDAPAYGWIESLYVEGQSLFANIKEVTQEFADMVSEGRYKKISASFWPVGGKGSPSPDVPSLRHVGFLGAAVPAVRGMKNAEFAESEQPYLTFGDENFSGYPANVRAMLNRNNNEAFVDRLLNEARFVSDQKEGILAFMNVLSSDEVVSFADSQGTLHNTVSLQWFKDFLSSYPPMVQFGEFDTGEEPLPSAPVNTPLGFKVDEEGLVLHAQATKLAEEKNIPYSEAVLLASSQQGEF